MSVGQPTITFGDDETVPNDLLYLFGICDIVLGSLSLSWQIWSLTHLQMRLLFFFKHLFVCFCCFASWLFYFLGEARLFETFFNEKYECFCGGSVDIVVKITLRLTGQVSMDKHSSALFKSWKLELWSPISGRFRCEYVSCKRVRVLISIATRRTNMSPKRAFISQCFFPDVLQQDPRKDQIHMFSGANHPQVWQFAMPNSWPMPRHTPTWGELHPLGYSWMWWPEKIQILFMWPNPLRLRMLKKTCEWWEMWWH